MSTTILTGLADICNQYPWQKKLLISPSRLWGHALLNSLSAGGINWLHVKPVTLTELAADIVGSEQDIMDSISIQAIVADLIRGLQEQKNGYFSSATEAYRLVPLMARFVTDCRMAGIRPDDGAGGIKWQNVWSPMTLK